jgi:hypothetical protein
LQGVGFLEELGLGLVMVTAMAMEKQQSKNAREEMMCLTVL